MYLKLCFLTILVHLTSLAKGDDLVNKLGKNGTHTIRLNRQKTPFEQHLNNAHFLKKHGVDFDWLTKKHKGSNRTNDSIALYRYLDNEFYGTVVIGHPGQILNVAFDTAWTLSWVLSSECYDFTNMGCWFHRRYDHSKSSEYKPDGRKISVPEGNYNLTGFFSYDNISFAHSNVTNFLFAEMTSVPRTMLFSKIDGVLGLGLQNQGDAYEPFFYALAKQKKVKERIFCIYLNRDKQSSHGGNIILGFLEKRHINHTRIPGTNKTVYDTVKYMPIKPGAFWRFDLERVYVNVDKEGPLEFCSDGTCSAMTDTSSNNILGPQEDIDKIHKAIKARPFFLNRYTVDCDTVNKLPIIAFNIGGQNFTLKGRDYTVKLSYLSVTLCLSAFVPSESQNLWVLGGAFLSEYYTIYNIDDKQIGIVKAA